MQDSVSEESIDESELREEDLEDMRDEENGV